MDPVFSVDCISYANCYRISGENEFAGINAEKNKLCGSRLTLILKSEKLVKGEYFLRRRIILKMLFCIQHYQLSISST